MTAQSKYKPVPCFAGGSVALHGIAAVQEGFLRFSLMCNAIWGIMRVILRNNKVIADTFHRVRPHGNYRGRTFLKKGYLQAEMQFLKYNR